MISNDSIGPALALRRAMLFSTIREHLLDPEASVMFACPVSRGDAVAEITLDLGVGSMSSRPDLAGIRPEIVLLSHTATGRRAAPVGAFVASRDESTRAAARRTLKIGDAKEPTPSQGRGGLGS